MPTHTLPNRPLAGLLLPCLLLLAVLFIGYRDCTPAGSATLPAVHTVPVPPPSSPRPPKIDPTIPLLALQQCPPHVRRAVAWLRSTPGLRYLRGYRGGKVFRNAEQLLPRGGRYHEFDVHPLRAGVSRGTERLVTSADKARFYYTSDHYTTFTQIQLP